MSGARLVLAVPGGQQDGDYLAGLIARGVASPGGALRALDATGVLTGQARTSERVPEPPSASFCSGEAAPAELARRSLPAVCRGVHFTNLYGPTEAAVEVTYCQYDPALEQTATVPILGRYPLANTTVYVLDGAGQPVPVGMAGSCT